MEVVQLDIHRQKSQHQVTQNVTICPQARKVILDALADIESMELFVVKTRIALLTVLDQGDQQL